MKAKIVSPHMPQFFAPNIFFKNKAIVFFFSLWVGLEGVWEYSNSCFLNNLFVLKCMPMMFFLFFKNYF